MLSICFCLQDMYSCIAMNYRSAFFILQALHLLPKLCSNTWLVSILQESGSICFPLFCLPAPEPCQWRFWHWGPPALGSLHRFFRLGASLWAYVPLFCIAGRLLTPVRACAGCCFHLAPSRRCDAGRHLCRGIVQPTNPQEHWRHSWFGEARQIQGRTPPS